jgi:hypothetical protein
LEFPSPRRQACLQAPRPAPRLAYRQSQHPLVRPAQTGPAAAPMATSAQLETAALHTAGGQYHL